MWRRIKGIPVSLAMVFMVLLIMGGVVMGNRNALNRASVSVWAELADLQAQVGDMADKAGNYLKLAGRLGIPDQEMKALTNAQDAALRFANQSIRSYGINAAVKLNEHAAALDEAAMALDARIRETQQSVTERNAVYDDWRIVRLVETDKDAYNQNAQHLRSMYASLPARVLLSGIFPPLFK